MVRDWGKNFEIYVTTAGVLSSNIIGKIGKNKVTIPSLFYKIIYSPDREIMIGFLMPNKKISNNLKSYVVTIDKIESITGIDFFSQLQDNIENKLESNLSVSDWNFD